jgi:quinol monooxygenase YgiN
MLAGIAGGVGLLIAGVALVGAAPASAATPSLQGSFPLVELRQYTLHDGQRDVLIELFEREFIETQEAQGMKVLGTFTDLDRPNRFVWLRGYRDMDSRLRGLTAFYGGPVWQAHRAEANPTMIDSDNVLLLRAPPGAEFTPPSTRPASGEQAPGGLVVATIDYLKVPPANALRTFETRVKPALQAKGMRPLAWFVPESAPNNFPGLPVREGERVLVWFTAFKDTADHAAHKAALDEASAPLAPMLARGPEVLRLKPTQRSLIRGPAGAQAADGVK